ncbi:acyloxyacyl hydrolase [Paraburkholderia sp. CI3]|uniref:acyloxyacyl hydrolase n=1 Tax=Paraburkholderia sp. CI3 TaxID=2991060 RepID=UPI003D1D521E
MNRQNLVVRGLTLKSTFAVLPVLLLGAAGASQAEQFGVQVAAGVGDHHVRTLDLGVVWDPNLTWWQIGDWHFALLGEAHVAWWHTNEGNVHDNIGEIGVTPVIRFIRSSGSVRPFIEVGAGVRLLTSPRISSDFTLGTWFQFAEMVGVGLQFGAREQYVAGYRFQHVSNGGIKEPNPGINFSQLYLQYHF